MAIKQIPIDEALIDDLRSFAEVVLGLEVPKRATEQTIRGKIAEAGWTRDVIVLDDASAGIPTGSQNNSLVNIRPREDDKGNAIMGEGPDGEPEQEREIKILVHTSDKPGGDEPVFASVNGRGIYIPRGERVWVPEKFVRVLDDAVELHYPEYDPNKNDGRGGLDAPREVKSYPFSFV